MGFTEGRKLRYVIFVIIESGMALLVIQLARAVLVVIGISLQNEIVWAAPYYFIAAIHEMLNVITSSVMAILCFTDNVDLARV